MSPWNLLPLGERATVLRRWTVGLGGGFSALCGGALVALLMQALEVERTMLQDHLQTAQAQLKDLQQQTAQLQQAQMQARQLQENGQHVQALRQRALRLLAIHQQMAGHWPADVQVQEWRVEGAAWQLQGPATSVQGVNQVLLALAPHGPWQQPPTLLELAATPALAGQVQTRLRYMAQGRWSEPGLLATSSSDKSGRPGGAPPVTPSSKAQGPTQAPTSP
jgi:hypothetical protein